ncbi:MAG: GPW/gp25 family protein [Bacteroidia bacterium]
MEKAKEAFLGIGIRHPFRISPSTGKTSMIEGVDNIKQSIRAILSTKPGERLYHSDFGIDLSDLLFENTDEGTLKEMEERISEGLMKYQSMIIVDSVDFEVKSSEGLVNIQIEFTIRSTNTRANYVYPYYIQEANQF